MLTHLFNGQSKTKMLMQVGLDLPMKVVWLLVDGNKMQLDKWSDCALTRHRHQGPHCLRTMLHRLLLPWRSSHRQWQKRRRPTIIRLHWLSNSSPAQPIGSPWHSCHTNIKRKAKKFFHEESVCSSPKSFDTIRWIKSKRKTMNFNSLLSYLRLDWILFYSSFLC